MEAYRQLIMAPLPPDVGMVKCTIFRSKYAYTVHLSESFIDAKFKNKTYVMSAKKQYMSKTSYYKVTVGTWNILDKSLRHSDSDLLLGKVKGEFGGLNFFIYDHK